MPDFAPGGKIICIGRNYAEHAAEMGHDPERSQPFFFFKPASALLLPGEDFIYPDFSREVHHELELVVRVAVGGRHLKTEQTEINGFAIGLDMTCRDLQRVAKQQGRPWELAKGFDGSAPCSEFIAGNLQDLEKTSAITLERNGVIVQSGLWRDMIWSIPELMAEVSRYIALTPGDLIFTGTPAGVGEVARGDRLIARLDDVCKLTLSVI
ncbi:fumarylacetoacetate hydrolase family protein [Gilvimarinus sp. DA14]|uniref:fumarylacetoacetate hydrolase family protein n=1 Tax=Gilvimarinus sp. DA14 TaxID=2956798 RepID=UPI0020B7A9AC|nr:fumarylacetoacetate hydrolase family protein [Gilvimarinus sp. DA14]UTF59114.1 fumarylacetoacetate hydrolase family protein [Gilvimarinus sp. DA14]